MTSKRPARPGPWTCPHKWFKWLKHGYAVKTTPKKSPENITKDKIKLSKELNIIKTSAFEGCTSLQEVTIPNKCKRLDSYIFADCVGLKEIILPRSLKEVGLNIFYDNDFLKTIKWCQNISHYFSLNWVNINVAWAISSLGWLETVSTVSQAFL